MVLASKTKDGAPTPIEDLGIFLPFDENNLCSFKIRSPEQPDKMVDIRVEKFLGLFRFYADGVLKGSIDTADTVRAHRCHTVQPVSVSFTPHKKPHLIGYAMLECHKFCSTNFWSHFLGNKSWL